MKAGLSSSVILHAALIGFGLITLSAPPAHDAGDVQALPVDIVPIEQLTELRQGDKTASVQETPAPKQTERIDEVPDAKNAGDNDIDLDDVPKPQPKPRKVETAAAPPPPPTPEVKPEPKPAEPTPPEPKPAPVTPPPEPVAETPPPPEPKPEPTPDPVAEAIEQAEAPKPDQAQDFPDVLPKPMTRPERPQKVAQAEKPREKTPDKKTEKTADQKQQPDDLESLLDDAKALINREKPAGGGADRSRRQASLGNDKPSSATKLSASEMDALRQRLAGCWSIPAGVDDASMLKVSVKFRLDRSGELEARPQVIAGGASSGPGRTAAESAVRAVQKCAPFNLPADKYETWSEVVVNFDPSDMF